MSLQQRYLKTLAKLLPAGALGISLALGASLSASASEETAGQQSPVIDKGKVSERLSAIRNVVSALAGPATDLAKAEDRLAWGNIWNNWHNW